jgi:glycerophosphoryl diester phosphodiesterase
VSDWTRPHPLWIVGHRGAPRKARENTIESFDLAESLGTDAIEFDLQQTRDGELVVFHDDKIPIGSEQHPVREMIAADVVSLLLESPFGEYRIPTFEQVLQRYGTSLEYVVELKSTPVTNRVLAARRAVEVIRNFAARQQCLVASFDGELLKKIRERDAEIALSFLFDHPVALPAPEGPAPLFPPCDAVGPRANLVTPELVLQARAAGLSVNPWTVDDPEEMQKLAKLEVSSLTTNDCELARRIFPRDS